MPNVATCQSNSAPLGCGEWEVHIMDVQLTNRQQLRDAVMLKWIKVSEECLRNLIQTTPQRINAVLKANGDPTQNYPGNQCA